MRVALDAQKYDLLFLERPWSDAMVGSLSGLRVVAYCRDELVHKGLVELGVSHASRRTIRALVDALSTGASFEHIDGVIFRKNGEVVARSNGVSPTMLGELRGADYDFAHRRVLSAQGANPKRIVVASNTGCAYRNAPNRTGVFDDVEMPAQVKTLGCTFCDVMPYEKMTEDEAIALIVKQVETALRERPEVSEIAVKDDYALRFLLALGDALKPLGVENKRILLSARADYLLQFRAEIEEGLAGRFPAALGFYLIGFENFSQAELERFNKGMSASQIERVLVLMREWAERFPKRFTLSPTGGFILFTPWTTLEDLRINANAIRQLGFAEFRGKALLSQLRLYPNLPLYWLAKRDGLLIDRFERDDMSDAFRRGYESDHPWRFRDPKVESVHRRLLDASSMSDADMFGVFEDALDEVAGVAKGKRDRANRMVRAPRDEARRGPSTHQIALNRECNQACAFCYARGVDTLSDRQRAARAIQAVHAAAKQGVRTLIVGGAEPTREWYLADLIRMARDLGIEEVVIETNATSLADPAVIAELVGAGLTGALVAYNAIDPATSDAITRDRGGHARTEAGLRALLDAELSV
ncbi:MAG: radical SAM protein [Polyangiaceae bacterium]